MSERTPVVKGLCVECGFSELELILGKPFDQIRWHLVKPVYCEHCSIWLTAAIRDQAGRFWGRRQVWHD